LPTIIWKTQNSVGIYCIVFYLQQEGRGIGLANKLAAYSMQEQGFDTVDANRVLSFPDDCRQFLHLYALTIASNQILIRPEKYFEIFIELFSYF
jgi:GTP cyclohydrolase II